MNDEFTVLAILFKSLGNEIFNLRHSQFILLRFKSVLVRAPVVVTVAVAVTVAAIAVIAAAVTAALRLVFATTLRSYSGRRRSFNIFPFTRRLNLIIIDIIDYRLRIKYNRGLWTVPVFIQFDFSDGIQHIQEIVVANICANITDDFRSEFYCKYLGLLVAFGSGS